VEHEADVRRGGGELSRIEPIAANLRALASGKPSRGMKSSKSSVKVETLLRVGRPGSAKFNTPMMIFAKSTPTSC
jgi:hypothetical protein